MPQLLKSPWDKTDKPIVLVVEDSNQDFYAFLRAFKQVESSVPASFALLRFDNGDDAFDYLFREEEYADLDAPYPIAALLDLNLPGMDGRDILQAIKDDPRLYNLPTVALTTSSNPKDIETTKAAGINGYLVKQMGSTETLGTVESLFVFWTRLASLPHPIPRDGALVGECVGSP